MVALAVDATNAILDAGCHFVCEERDLLPCSLEASRRRAARAGQAEGLREQHTSPSGTNKQAPKPALVAQADGLRARAGRKQAQAA